MQKKEAEKIILDYVRLIFIERGYLYKKKYGGFVKLSNEGYNSITIGMFSYFPLQAPTYAIAKRYNIVENIYKKLSDKFHFTETITPIDFSFWFSEDTLQGKMRSAYLPAVETEAEMVDSAKHIKEFMIKIGFPMLDKYSNLPAIDTEINGNDFWQTDWMHKFALGGGFHFKRLIIAKLCNNPRFDILYAFHLAEHEEVKKKFPDQKPTLIDGKTSMEYLVEVLLKDDYTNLL